LPSHATILPSNNTALRGVGGDRLPGRGARERFSGALDEVRKIGRPQWQLNAASFVAEPDPAMRAPQLAAAQDFP